ncbi:hypothetical protein Nepgr_010687 [Nepenthes gracilis]|uniref:Uncharacterized protein n=1 Tax=Nepenthes gracilis TaxID=150966 RepID=A0AAD3XLA7_NEPGR|nr:hypothetical protein Nepgr_010687 [Nepenthes gracilis]
MFSWRLLVSFLFNSYDLNSSREGREIVRNRNRKEYEKLRRQCHQLLKQMEENPKQKRIDGTCSNGDGESPILDSGSPASEDVVSPRDSLSSERDTPDSDCLDHPSSMVLDRANSSRRVTSASPSIINTESSDSDMSEDDNVIQASPSMELEGENYPVLASKEHPSPSNKDVTSKPCCANEFASWQRIIRLDAVRANLVSISGGSIRWQGTPLC